MEIDSMAGHPDQACEAQSSDPICQLIFQSDLRSILFGILEAGDQTTGGENIDNNGELAEILRMMKLESLWIMSNVTFSSNDALNFLIHNTMVI